MVLIRYENFAHPDFSDKNDINAPPKLLDQVCDTLRMNYYAIRTEQSYLYRIKRYIYFHGKVSASTKNQAKSALLFLYCEMLEIKMPWLGNVT
ncbi:phage integrase N-terminal SAM-like domain-containing protein [Candidatus Nitrotoga sp. M5]|uniref:phage integrase N-terminal SAM-like domain-containing protein n=1 Tax=Candidatus Nitrotoga sp. M5 TaxID=2890409 RepID=UPI001FA580AB|nr:phage integrase N-terminal SAM-like domain-containing protein [Candidatus Nitrotoga sp. M5]CAH1385499.1 hypothetical protein NTGM5_130031 [Candidatus Nitrotoga sp. M5]